MYKQIMQQAALQVVETCNEDVIKLLAIRALVIQGLDAAAFRGDPKEQMLDLVKRIKGEK